MKINHMTQHTIHTETDGLENKQHEEHNHSQEETLSYKKQHVCSWVEYRQTKRSTTPQGKRRREERAVGRLTLES